MIQLHKQLMETRGVSETSASQYLRNLYSLNNRLPFTNLAWTKNVESVNQRLSEFAESTQKNLLATLVTTLSLVKDKSAYSRIYAYWFAKMMDAKKEADGKDSKVKTEAQDENWISWEVVKAHEERLKEEVGGLKKNELSLGQWDKVLSLMVLSLYTLFPPRRNQDYQLMKVVKKRKDATEVDVNYLLLDESKFLFQKYKTAKTHGAQEFPIPKDLMKIVKVYLSFRPTWKGAIPFLVHLDGSPLVAVNSITRILNHIFGKRVGATMLRHIYLSSKYDVSEMDKDAEAMAHSSVLQHDYLKSGAGEEVSTVNIPTC